MPFVKKVVLDVLRPHLPGALEFSKAIAGVGSDYRVHLTVLAMDEATETTKIEIDGSAIDFEAIQKCIIDMGGSLHSVDEVLVDSDDDAI